MVVLDACTTSIYLQPTNGQAVEAIKNNTTLPANTKVDLPVQTSKRNITIDVLEKNQVKIGTVVYQNTHEYDVSKLTVKVTLEENSAVTLAI